MVIAFDRLFLWRQSSLALSDQAPDYQVDAHQFLQPYYDKGGFDGRAPSSDAMEILVTGWLSDLIRSLAEAASIDLVLPAFCVSVVRSPIEGSKGDAEQPPP